MVKVVRGVLIKCDSAARELILHWNVTEKFVLRAELDSDHVLVRADALPSIVQRFRELNAELNYVPPLDQAENEDY